MSVRVPICVMVSANEEEDKYEESMCKMVLLLQVEKTNALCEEISTRRWYV